MHGGALLMKLFDAIERGFRKFLPSPFTIAVILTLLTFCLAWAFTGKSEESNYPATLASYWQKELWSAQNLAFAVQMMLMLVLGHVLALTKPADAFIGRMTKYGTSTSRAAALVTFLTILVALFNWGLGLIFGAILARKMGEHARRKGVALNYPLIGAAGYSGLMVWHGGISGTAPLKAAEAGHIKEQLMQGISTPEQLAKMPDSIAFSETVFGPMNVTATLLLLVFLPLFMYWLGMRVKSSEALPKTDDIDVSDEEFAEGAEKLDLTRWFSLGFGGLIFLCAAYFGFKEYQAIGLGFITPNFINSLLLALALIFHQSIREFLKSVDKAIVGASGILIQFPLYFGILGILKYSGMVGMMSDFFTEISTATSFPIWTFFSSGLVNVFIPSGGGQWMIQGPVVLQAASDLGVPAPKAIMALAYGDQLTNMLQPFWALPLLGITGLKARSILPYTFALMLVGIVIFTAVLLLF